MQSFWSDARFNAHSAVKFGIPDRLQGNDGAARMDGWIVTRLMWTDMQQT